MSDERWHMLMTPDRVGMSEPGRITPQLIPFRLLEEDRDDHDLSLRVSVP